MLGIYVHLPFCPYICPYCDFAKWPLRRSSARRYLDALVREIDAAPRVEAATMFLGGGTPNTYDASDVAALVERLRARFPAPEGIEREISIEVNPELVRADDFAAYRAAGIDRVSIGVQSFVPEEIRTLGRRHNERDVARAVDAARAASMRSVSIDLIFGTPGTTPQRWRESLERAIALGVDHLSTYGLTVEENTPFSAWEAREPAAFLDQDREAELYDIAIAVLEGAGFEHYEISNFARPGHRSRHNANYWSNGEYLGFGVGAASYRDGERSVHTRLLDEYLRAVESEVAIPAESERLSPLAAAGEAIMLALRTAQGVDLPAFKERYGVDVLERYAPVVETYAQAGMLEVSREALRLTRRGRFIANDVCGAFISLE
jgi:oxygen-independent coproporphyrinogen-3 oxidase